MRSLIIASLLCSACASTPLFPRRPDPDVLAAKVVRAHGNLKDVERVAFSFVVVVNGEEKLRRSYVRDFAARSLVAQLPEGRVELNEVDPEAWSRRVKGADEGDLEAKAWSAFINDFFWLVAPSKVFDKGTVRSVDRRGRLIVRYRTGGVTPGDTYRFTVDDDGRVTGWSYTLAKGQVGASEWTKNERFGPLLVSTLRSARGRPVELRFEDVSVLEKPHLRGSPRP